MPRSLTVRLVWLLGLVALTLVLAIFALVPFAAVAFAAFTAGLEPSIAAHQVPPAPAQVPQPTPVASSVGPRTITQGIWLWQRTEYGDDTSVAAPDPSKYTVSFRADGRLALQVDCNRGTGAYTVDGPRLTLEPGATTLIACGPGSQDRAFLRDLRNVGSYVFDGANLVLNLKLDGGTMIFSPQPSTSLVDSAWRVQSYNNGRGGVVSVLPDVQLTVLFGADGAVAGNAGCNNYRGPYTITGDRITFGPIISTKRACLSEALTQQETAFLAALEASTAYTLVGDRLPLRDDAGATQVLLVRPSVQPVRSPAPAAP